MLRLLARNGNARHSHLIHDNGLYYGTFTKEEYEEAKSYVTTQYLNLEKEIKGTHNVRENLGKMPQFPSFEPRKPVHDLLSFFQETIKTTGPISLSAYMRQCLTHPQFGYYTTRDPLDPLSGDFITSPEISSVFGEMVGTWLYTVWESQGSPKNVNFIEFGPGKGTLMTDTVRVFSKFATLRGVQWTGNIVLVEASPVLREKQREELCVPESKLEKNSSGFFSAKSKWGSTVTWVYTEKDIVFKPEDCNYALVHEFFDALPIRSFVNMENGWRELLVEHSPSVMNTQSKLPLSEEVSADSAGELEMEFHLTASIRETPSSVIPTVRNRLKNLPIGSRIEVCADAEFYMKRIVELVRGSNGAALIVDYGPADEVPLNSLRGIYKHKFVSPFYKPGEVDLSIDVDFGNLKVLAGNKVAAFGPAEQGDWLHEMGIGHRFDQLIKAANLMANKELLYESYLRLTSKEERGMGKIYKFLALMPPGSAKPAGFGHCTSTILERSK
ncbi:hypothetical protein METBISCDRAFT_29342 [Metschnikowia bicuspidata]|uniref:Protein arginine methyltransferase NDUFAF7 n=1 Tax=Metschnikowia bicuspidata TaxID=27322 RepID=A0A4P9ZIC5_9ASCO|nr:hypothetical protein METBISCDRAFT_29342 [Metschnikowia bicuspidata]